MKLIFAALAAGFTPIRRIYPASGDTYSQVSHSDQVIGRHRQDEAPVDLLGSSVEGFAKQSNRLEPAERLFDPLAELLARGVALVPGGTAIDGGTASFLGSGSVPGYVGRDVQRPHGFGKAEGIVVPVSRRFLGAILPSISLEVSRSA